MNEKQKDDMLYLQFQKILKENAYKIVKLILDKEGDENFKNKIEKTGRSQFVNLAQIINSEEISSIQELKLFLDYQHKRNTDKCFEEIKKLIDIIMKDMFNDCIKINPEIKKRCEEEKDSVFYRRLQLMMVERLLVYLYWKTIKN